MNNSIEEVYLYVGQYDSIAIINFKNGSESEKEYGSTMIGTFHYSPEERFNLTQKVSTPDYEKTYGLVKVKNLDTDLYTIEKIQKLKLDGILTSDILSIKQLAFEKKNQHLETGTKSLPKKTEIKFDASGTTEEDLFLYVMELQLKSNYKITDFDRNRFNAVTFRRNEHRISGTALNNFIDQETGEVKHDIKIHYLKSKFFYSVLTEDEDTEFKALLSKETSKRLKTLDKELQKTTVSKKNIFLKYNDAYQILLYFTIHFETQKLNSGKFPVWIDCERFLHIYLRHVEETRIGEKYEKEKSTFNYELKEIVELMKMIISELESEIQSHFKNFPDKEFRLMGSRSFEFQGDYYAIQINTKGKLMRFHVNNAKPKD